MQTDIVYVFLKFFVFFESAVKQFLSQVNCEFYKILKMRICVKLQSSVRISTRSVSEVYWMSLLLLDII